MTLTTPPWKAACCAGLLFGFCSSAYAADSVSLELGKGNGTRLTRIGVQWTWDRVWRKRNNTHIGAYWDVNLAQLRSDRFQNQASRMQRLTALGVTPVFRLQNENLTGLYGEAGVGLALLSDLYDNNGHRLSTSFQFASQLGIGYVFRNGVDLGLKIQHFSNGSIKKPNNGVNFVVARVSYRF